MNKNWNASFSERCLCLPHRRRHADGYESAGTKRERRSIHEMNLVEKQYCLFQRGVVADHLRVVEDIDLISHGVAVHLHGITYSDYSPIVRLLRFCAVLTSVETSVSEVALLSTWRVTPDSSMCGNQCAS